MSDLFRDKNISPMLLYESEPFDDPDCIFELKWDGVRCIAYLGSDTVLHNKRFKEVTELYPELAQMHNCVRHNTVLDGEIVALTDGKPDFFALQKRTLLSDRFRIGLRAKQNPVQFVAYDILYSDGRDLTDLPQTERKAVLFDRVQEGNGLSISRYIEKEGIAFFALAKEQALEGIVAKRKNGRYHIGKRTRDWVKIKVMQDEDVFVVGYQPDEDGGVKDLILGYCDGDGRLACRGKVYLGVSEAERNVIRKFAQTHMVPTPWFSQYAHAVWLLPQLVGTVHYMHETPSGSLRQPVWKGLRDDK